MSLLAHLYIGDNFSGNYNKEYRVTACHIKLAREHTHYAPDTDPRCDLLHVVIVAPDKDDLELQEWYIERSALSGKIVIDLSNQAAKYDPIERTIEFEEAKCVSIAEHYEIDAPYRHLFEFECMAETLKIDGNTYQ